MAIVGVAVLYCCSTICIIGSELLSNIQNNIIFLATLLDITFGTASDSAATSTSISTASSIIARNWPSVPSIKYFLHN